MGGVGVWIYEEGLAGGRLVVGGSLRQSRRRSGEIRGWRERDGRPVSGRGVRLGLEGGGGDFTSVKG